jgi:bifunctional non-homologous end joining protein LigD
MPILPRKGSSFLPSGRHGPIDVGKLYLGSPAEPLATAILPAVARLLPAIWIPMAATQVARPFHRAHWISVEKLDGWRVLAYKEASKVRLVSRQGRDLTRRFPDIAAAMTRLQPSTLILDGEIAVFDNRLLSRFEWLRSRPKDEVATPPTLIAFDCLYLRGRDLRDRPLRQRREAFEEAIEGETVILPARRLAPDGLEAWTQVTERGYDGLVGKDEASPYREGRTLSWLKVKVPHYREGERGWEPRRG